MFTIEKKYKKYNLTLNAIKMGPDWNISIYGGANPHIGAIALGIPRPSLQNPNLISSTVSVITVTGHKDDSLAINAAKKISSALNGTVTTACGINIPNITKEEIADIYNIIHQLIQEFISSIKSNKL